VHADTLEILRCPYCGGRLRLVTSLFHQVDGDDIDVGILGCHCCIFPIVSGIPILHLQPAATAARDHVQAGRPDLARRSMFGLDDDQQAEAFEAAASSKTATYRDLVDALGPTFEGGYFLYRFSDPTFVVADAVVRSLARTVLVGGGRAIDLCGGSGHLTRALLDHSSIPPVLADLYFAKVWLGQRFTAPGCEAVCCDGNEPMPFARGAFRFAMCVDAFMYIWTKRRFVADLTRLVEGPDNTGVALIGHTHNELVWCPSHGQPLSPAGYRDLFETMEPRIFGEGRLFDDVVGGGPLDLSRRDSDEVVNQDAALTIVASRRADVYSAHPLDRPPAPRGELRLNPLYAVEPDGDKMRLRLRFPNEDYESEYGACRRYLPDTLLLDRTDLTAIVEQRLPPHLSDLVTRRVIVDLPTQYY
jgi:uncharacterized protein YbaR (Trm112 family)